MFFAIRLYHTGHAMTENRKGPDDGGGTEAAGEVEPAAAAASIFQGDRMTAALLDRLTHRCTIFEMNGESYRFRESAKAAKEKRTTTK